ncbi:Clp protease N-terminal domain-containing protein [Streptomyces sp. NPDC014894]|uniref:Clp protease N-terminal domain-containing protein n=1 Tax=Streptomyces sp. NPDC014894 TaxID=3364931 RepID=UPI0036F4D1B6
MFERFTQEARDVVKGSVALSERMGADRVTDEHLLLALLEQKGTRTAFALSALGLPDRRASLEQALARARRSAGLSRSESDALAGLGIDVAEIVARVEENHGPGALAARGRQKRWWHGSYAPAAKETLVRSLHIATERGDRRIGGEHLLLALTAAPGAVAEALADHGATYRSVARLMPGGADA